MSHYADSPDSTFREDINSPWFKAYSYINPNSQVLDVGCSGGGFGKVLIEKKSCIVDGIELDPDDAKRAASILRHVYTNNIETEGDKFLGEKVYDFVYFGDVLEHLVDPAKVLRLIKKHLAPKGIVVFSVPNMSHMSVRLMLLKGEFRYGEMGLLDKTHLHFYDEEEIRRVVYEAGYDFVDFDYIKRDIPRDVLRAELSQIGLKPTKSFLDKTKQVSSSAYQFIGCIKPVSKPRRTHPRPKLSPPIDEMERHIEYLKEVHKAQIDAHVARIKELEGEATSLTTRIGKLEQRQLLRRLKRKLKP